MPNAYSVFHLSLDMDIYFKITTSVWRDTEIESEVVWLHSSQIFCFFICFHSQFSGIMVSPQNNDWKSCWNKDWPKILNKI